MGASSQGGEPLDVHAEQTRDRLSLGVAELGELLRHPADRTVALAQLDPVERAGGDRTSGRGEAVLGHHLDEHLGAIGDVVPGVGEARRIPALEGGDPLASKGGYGVWPSVLVEVAQRLSGQLVVSARQGAVPPLGHHVGPGWPAPAARMSWGWRWGRLVLLDGAVVGQGVEMAADRCGGQAQQSPDLGRSDGTVLGDGGQHAFACALLVAPDKHHTIVT